MTIYKILLNTENCRFKTQISIEVDSGQGLRSDLTIIDQM